jgi:carbon storage regulator
MNHEGTAGREPAEANNQTRQGGVNMLVLTRRIGEEIVIDGQIRVIVTGVRGDRVRVGIVAPDSVRIDRREVHQQISQFAGAHKDGALKERFSPSLRAVPQTSKVR